MQRLTPIEWARTRDKVLTLSVPDRGPEVARRMVEWLEARPGSGWFYARGDNFYFGAAADAAAFKQWLVGATAA
ncbi:hypothetical protein D3C87_1344610 [compost metagenome]